VTRADADGLFTAGRKMLALAPQAARWLRDEEALHAASRIGTFSEGQRRLKPFQLLTFDRATRAVIHADLTYIKAIDWRMPS
jgi:hypothetical protein